MDIDQRPDRGPAHRPPAPGPAPSRRCRCGSGAAPRPARPRGSPRPARPCGHGSARGFLDAFIAAQPALRGMFGGAAFGRVDHLAIEQRGALAGEVHRLGQRFEMRRDVQRSRWVFDQSNRIPPSPSSSRAESWSSRAGSAANSSASRGLGRAFKRLPCRRCRIVHRHESLHFAHACIGVRCTAKRACALAKPLPAHMARHANTLTRGTGAQHGRGNDRDQHSSRRRQRLPPKPAKKQESFFVFLLKLVLIVLVFRSFIFSPFNIPSESMLPRLVQRRLPARRQVALRLFAPFAAVQRCR